MNLMSFSYPTKLIFTTKKRSQPLILHAQTKTSHTHSQIQCTQPIPLTQKIQQFGAPQNYKTIYLYAQNLSINYCKEIKHLYRFYDKKDAFMTCKTSQRCFEVTNRKLLKILDFIFSWAKFNPIHNKGLLLWVKANNLLLLSLFFEATPNYLLFKKSYIK